jgi:CDP-diacylglycerol--serine O-phosphatidyltransferase
MNLFCGFLAIISIAEGRLAFGAWLIVFAGLFDALDGFMARLSNATSQFGIELDSISDVVSFGVAPGFLLYGFGLNSLPFVGIILSALPPLCGAVRLARYNVDVQDSRPDYFKGLPIPAQAIMIAAFYLTFNDRLELFMDFENGINAVLIPLIILLSFLIYFLWNSHSGIARDWIDDRILCFHFKRHSCWGYFLLERSFW